MQTQGDMEPGTNPAVDLPEPRLAGTVSIEQTLAERRSVRSFAPAALDLDQVSQLAWAAQGVTRRADGFRTAPSAGATYPLEIDLLVSGMAEIPDGVYRYDPGRHRLEHRITGDLRRALHDAALRQSPILAAPVVMVISGQVSRTARRYGARATRYVFMEAGHAAQNVYLQGVALDIGTVVIGAFHDREVTAVLELREGEQPLYILPLGRTTDR
ncbi:SagB-type dehydrogenase domain protein [Thioalkalivibrio nitratireducens DSM 14787]|uniref:SagB-type dehydrogenase domain protein n=1 Tax=Thioalkalivibrio nitratireducens (strain DSM 14787 / UNIQEM 213 / ALEN2) TaxID=1255043 RepID=L0E1X5_THIND|nr:SagB-type dehydrogenase domain protein [Thioalkalivibrio nitratireducens DSM 14787]